MVSRRTFLTGAAVALAGRAAVAAALREPVQRGLDQFMVSSAVCTDKTKLTPSAPDDAGFRPGAPERKMIAPAGASGTRVVVTGGVAGLACGRIAGARVDFWQRDPSGALDATGFRYRGYQLTDASGGFQLTTVMPGASPGRAPHLSARVVVPGKETLTTELFFPDDRQNARDPRFRPELVMQPRAASDVMAMSFEFILDL